MPEVKKHECCSRVYREQYRLSGASDDLCKSSNQDPGTENLPNLRNLLLETQSWKVS
jgi:hypothetical protein